MIPSEPLLLWVVAIAGFYMAWNIGANDVANAMGTSVGSKALSLRRAVIVAAILEFCGAYFFGEHVSETFQSGIIDFSSIDYDVRALVFGMLSTLIASGVWLQIASWRGWPVSTTHSIIGALVGFGIAYGGVDVVHWPMLGSIVSSWILSPILGGIVSYSLFNLLRQGIFYKQDPLHAAKILTPFLTMAVVSVITFIFSFHGIEALFERVSFWQALVWSACLGLVGFIIAKLLLTRVKEAPHLAKASECNPEVLIGLEKSKKHLLRVKRALSGELQYQVDSLIDEVESVSHNVNRLLPDEGEHSAFLAVENIFSYLQIISACLMAFAHGANDVANAIGPLSATVTLLTTGTIQSTSHIPSWTLALGGVGIVVGLATWGWRVILTIGSHITELTPTRGFAAEFSAALVVLFASRLGLPISTTHTLVGAVVGVGLARGIEALNMNTTRDIAISWCVTVPAGALLSIAIFHFLLLFK